MKEVTKEEYFEKIVQYASDNNEKIISIIKARGFLLDKKDTDYYVSDNATYDDCIYLRECLEKYNLGTIVGEECRTYHGRYVEYNVLIPYTAKIVLNAGANIQNAIHLFEDIQRVGFSICYQTRRWHEFVYRSFGPKVSVKCLEPYVSYYVKAISSCGVYTCFSCDGNHPNGGSIVLQSDYPFCYWHDFIIDNIIPKSITHKMEAGIKFNPETQYDIYYDVFLMADYLYSNREKIRYIKEKACEKLNRKFRKQSSEKLIKEMFIKNCKEIMESRDM